ncbi:histidine phosphatase family protein [Caldalkalibacillus salinus]|uniref:histidine phosphatase family protein n=1 Tax=Caldalkalibacillus salinus TaxID=2803787 RepID=UPI001921BDB2|nr:histidine phosphatase family protein [Caldalkalibacillus salinus]
MTTVCLIRHGETDWNAAQRIQGRQDIALNAKGKEQAQKCGHYLQEQDIQWEVIISSPLSRAKETATIIATALNLNEVIVHDSFIERDFGKASGLTKAEADRKYPNRSIPDIEDFEELQQRGLAGMNEILEQYQDKHVIVVAHGALINAMLHALSNGKVGSGQTTLHNACLNVLYHDREWTIREYNCISHLE